MEREPIARGMRPHRQTLDEDSASRMLQGLVHPDDAPPGYAAVADLLATATQWPPLDDEAGAPTISAMVEAIRAGAPVPQASRRKSMIRKLFAGKALAAMATVALTATGAAAATGSLPAPVQDAVAEAVSHVGVDLPAKGGRSAEHRQDGEHRPSDKGKPADGGGDAGTTSTTNKGSVISGIAHDPALDGQPKGPVVCDAASEGRCQAGERGQPEDGTPPTTGGAPEGKGKPADAGPSTTTTAPADDAEGDNTPPVTTGGKATGQERSGRDLTAPTGKGPSGR